MAENQHSLPLLACLQAGNTSHSATLCVLYWGLCGCVCLQTGDAGPAHCPELSLFCTFKGAATSTGQPEFELQTHPFLRDFANHFLIPPFLHWEVGSNHRV